MKKVDFTTFKTTTNGEVKEFFEEGLIYNDMEMLSIVDARKHFKQLFEDNPFLDHDPKDIEYVLDLYQKLELFDMSRIDFHRLHNAIAFHCHGENQPVWLHFDGAVTECVGDDFNLPNDEDQGVNPCVAVFKSIDPDVFDRNVSKEFFADLIKQWKAHIKESIESKMMEIESDHFNNLLENDLLKVLTRIGK